jgi:small GTP-binding protein
MSATAPIIKIFLSGEGGVGKTTMLERYIKGVFNQKTIMTIGVNHAVKNVTLSDGSPLTLQIWDLGGEERFRFIIPTYVKGSEVGVLCFDTTRFSTFRNLDPWITLIRENTPNTPIILVGTKMDLPQPPTDVKEYETFVKDKKLAGLNLTSSKTGRNIEEIFKKVIYLYEQNLKNKK